MITRTSPISRQPSPPSAPPMVAPKPSGKIITEYRTVRGIGNGVETTATITEPASSNTMNDNRLSMNSAGSHDALMESIRKFGGSQNLGRKLY